MNKLPSLRSFLILFAIAFALPATIPLFIHYFHGGLNAGAFTLLPQLIFLLLLFLALAFFMRRNFISQNEAEVTVKGFAFYNFTAVNDATRMKTSVPSKDVLKEISLRLNGISLPGYCAGWFRMREQKVFVLYLGGDSFVRLQDKQGNQAFIDRRMLATA